MEEQLQRLLDAHDLMCGVVLTTEGDVAARAGDFVAFGSADLVSVLLSPYGSARGTVAGLSGHLFPQL